MRLTFWPESILLQIADKCVKRFNWLTGRDNFYLAYATIAVANLLFLIVDITPHKFLAFWVLVVPPSLFIGVLILITQGCDNSERLRDAKRVELDLSLLLLRTTFLIMFFLALASSWIEPGIIFNPAEYIVLGSYPIAWYFASVKRPPFSRSRAWELFKDWFINSVLCPIAVRA